ncbi:MAG: ABC transporter ATP-binding protein [Anaerolineaceae bacterium]|nr:ABC transporter ATP-binding protein [Anaerolineaceae bacterium]
MSEHSTKQVIIETIDLYKIYGRGEAEVRALDGVSLQISEGNFVAIMGPSGSGKSTLMNILGCLDRPTGGNYLLAGEDVSSLNKTQLARIRNHKIGFVFQSYNLLPRMNALDNVILPLIYDPENEDTAAQHIERGREALARVGLSDRAEHLPSEMSGGQQQRVAIARALINHPVMILADEPTGNLDTQSSEEILALMHELNEQGSTIVMVTHEHDIALHTQRIIHLRDGKIEIDHQNGKHQIGASA